MLPAGNGMTFRAWSDLHFQSLARPLVISAKADVGRDLTCNGPGKSRQEPGGFDHWQAIGPAQQRSRLRKGQKAVVGSGRKRRLHRRRRGRVGEHPWLESSADSVLSAVVTAGVRLPTCARANGDCTGAMAPIATDTRAPSAPSFHRCRRTLRVISSASTACS